MIPVSDDKYIQPIKRGVSPSELIKALGVIQIAYSYHKFIHGQRPLDGNTRQPQIWNVLDEQAYHLALTGIGEIANP